MNAASHALAELSAVATKIYNLCSIHICTGTNVRYRARTRWHGFQRYELVGKPTRSYKVAIMRMARAFADNRNVKRADVIMTADYYDPVQLCELVRT